MMSLGLNGNKIILNSISVVAAWKSNSSCDVYFCFSWFQATWTAQVVSWRFRKKYKEGKCFCSKCLNAGL
jgi:hypothetical protein